MEQVKFSLRERPLSAISDVSGPPPPLPTSPPPDVDDDESAITSSSPLSHEPTEAETSLSKAGSEVAAIAARRYTSNIRIFTCYNILYFIEELFKRITKRRKHHCLQLVVFHWQ